MASNQRNTIKAQYFIISQRHNTLLSRTQRETSHSHSPWYRTHFVRTHLPSFYNPERQKPNSCNGVFVVLTQAYSGNCDSCSLSVYSNHLLPEFLRQGVALLAASHQPLIATQLGHVFACHQPTPPCSSYALPKTWGWPFSLITSKSNDATNESSTHAAFRPQREKPLFPKYLQ